MKIRQNTDMKATYIYIIGFLLRHRLWLISILLLSSIAAIVLIKDHLGINTDTKDMLAETLTWRQLDQQHERLFPQDTDTILIVLESVTADQAADAARILYKALQQLDKKNLFKTIYYPEYLMYFRKSAFLFQDTETLYQLADQLATIQPFLGALIRDPSTVGLLQLLSDALTAQQTDQKIELTPLLAEINRSLQALRDGKNYPVSWHSLLSNKKNTKKKYRQFILLQPRLDYGKLFPATPAVDLIRQQVKQLQLEKKYQVDVRLSGSAVLSDEELHSVANANWAAILLSLILISILLHIGFRSARIVCACLLTLICGLILTTAFATITVGNLNLISIAFAILYIGLGIDFAIHYALCYQEQCSHHPRPIDALTQSAAIMLRPLLLCTLTTAISFFAFIPTDYTGVAELGWIAGSGMFINLLLSLTLLPALLSYIHAPKKGYSNNSTVTHYLQQLPYRYPQQIICAAIITALIILTQITNITFDTNPLNLQDQENESVAVYKDLLREQANTPWTIITLVQDHIQAALLAGQLEQLDTVEKVIWLNDFIPVKQQERLAIIEEMGLLLADLTIEKKGKEIDQQTQRAALLAFQKRLMMNTSTDPELQQMRQNLAAITRKIDQGPTILTALENSLLQSFPGRIAALADALEADYIDRENMPDTLVKRWFNNGTYQLKIYPAQDINDAAALQDFVNSVKEIHPHIIGAPVINLAAGLAVSSAFQQAFIYSLLAISLLLLLLMRSIKDTLIILCTLLSGALLTTGFMLLFDISINFANIIALPLLLGIGVDSSIHIVNRYRSDKENARNILATMTARGIIISTLTTIFSIGNLAFSAHQGTASMGLLLTIGIAVMLFCTLIVLPALLTLTQQQTT